MQIDSTWIRLSHIYAVQYFPQPVKEISRQSSYRLLQVIACFHKKSEWREIRQVRIATTDPRHGGRGEAQRGRTHGEGATVWMTKGMWSGNSGQWESQSSIEDERVLLFSLDLLYIFILTQEMEIAIFSPNGEDLNPLLCNFRLNKFTPHLTNNKIQL
jgi:hypothetical protein